MAEETEPLFTLHEGAITLPLGRHQLTLRAPDADEQMRWRAMQQFMRGAVVDGADVREVLASGITHVNGVARKVSPEELRKASGAGLFGCFVRYLGELALGEGPGPSSSTPSAGDSTSTTATAPAVAPETESGATARSGLAE